MRRNVCRTSLIFATLCPAADWPQFRGPNGSGVGEASVVQAGADWEILAVNDLEEDTVATPAIADDRLYIRTRGTLYCFIDTD
jgi:hypothetical protein